MMTACAMSCCVACEVVPGTDPAFRDVQRRPPLTQAATVDWLVENDRQIAAWIAETARACDQYGCRP